MNTLKFKKLNENAIIPTRSYEGDAGLDLYSIENVFIPVGETRKIPTGIATSIPMGCVGKIEDRSGMANRGIRSGAGVVDAQYRGELSVVLHNLNCIQDTHIGQKGYQIKKGDRVAQILIYDIKLLQPEEVQELDDSERGTGGFSSTGR